MHHPRQYTALAKIQQAEMLQAAAVRRQAHLAQTQAPSPARRWWAVALACGAFGLAWLTLPFWAS